MILAYWLSLLLLIYIYFGYPFLIWLIGCLKPRSIRAGDHEPTVSILISAYNEERCIARTLANKLELDYPADKMEILVTSDSSTDRTDDIVRDVARQTVPERVRLFVQAPRQGKTAALNSAVKEAKGEILVFSDANSLYESDALRKLMRNFLDPEVGYVSGKMIYTNPDGAVLGDGCSAYMRYENYLRQWETRIGSVVGVDGGIDAVRKGLYRPMRADQLPDFVLPLSVVEQGYRVVYESEAVLREDALNSSEAEYRMRVRVSLRALWALWDMKRLLSLRKFGLFALQLVSHKWLRYLAFLFMICTYVANVLIWDVHYVYRYSLFVQSVFYGAAVVGLLLDRVGLKTRLLFIPYYFVLINVAAAHAFGKFLGRKKQVLWTPRTG